MSPAEGIPASTFRRVVTMVSVLILSVAMPAGIAAWSFMSTIGGKPLGSPSNEFKTYQGSLKNGELWFQVRRFPARMFVTKCEEFRYKRLDLTTGIEREAGHALSGEEISPFWIEGDLYAYVFASNAICRMAGESLEKVASIPAHSPQFFPGTFLFDGRLTTVVETDGGGFRLVHLVEGDWVDGRRILLPEIGSEWSDDPEVRLKRPLQKSSKSWAALSLSVLEHEHQLHVFCNDAVSFNAYRNGFEFVDEAGDQAPSVKPANSLDEVSGWEPIIGPERECSFMESDQQGLLFASYNSPFRVVRRNSDGQYTELAGFEHLKPSGLLSLLANPSEADSYVVIVDRNWSAAQVHRIQGNTIQPAHLTLRGYVPEYLARWGRLLIGLLLAWLSHLAVLIGGAQWLSRGPVGATYRFGIRQASLASPWKRSLAFAVDLLLALSILSLLVYAQLPSLEFPWTPDTEQEFAAALLSFETTIGQGITNGTIPSLRVSFALLINAIAEPFPEWRGCMMLLLADVMAVCALKVSLDCLFGITPGKWLLGIRCVRCTLRPIGIARTLVRNVFYGFDIPFLATPIAAAISVMMDEHRRRLGDRVADTIVICDGSIRNDDNHGGDARE